MLMKCQFAVLSESRLDVGRCQKTCARESASLAAFFAVARIVANLVRARGQGSETHSWTDKFCDFGENLWMFFRETPFGQFPDDTMAFQSPTCSLWNG